MTTQVIIIFFTKSPVVLLLLLGVSHLRNVAVHMNHDKWEIVDLCYCVTNATVAELTKNT